MNRLNTDEYLDATTQKKKLKNSCFLRTLNNDFLAPDHEQGSDSSSAFAPTICHKKTSNDFQSFHKILMLLGK